MRNHPAERARQIAAVERAGIDPRVGAWPGDPGGPSAEARLRPSPGPDPATVDSAILEREAYKADLEADYFAAEADRIRSKAEHLRNVAVVTDGEAFALCPVCGVASRVCEADGCGIAPEDARNAAILDRRASDLADLADTLEGQARSHADRVEVLRARAEDLYDRADGAA